uniref:Protein DETOXIFICATION n=1 Tax=Aegilops tauschii subsp. strangulata TaxID=200361 RepID=A0A453DW77_AEGTS
GLWMGIICGVLVQVLLLMIITLCTDWRKEVLHIYANTVACPCRFLFPRIRVHACNEVVSSCLCGLNMHVTHI